MSRYFFHTVDGVREQDADGTELPHHDAARIEAIKLIAALLIENPRLLMTDPDFHVEVTDLRGMVLFTVVASMIDAPAVRPS